MDFKRFWIGSLAVSLCLPLCACGAGTAGSGEPPAPDLDSKYSRALDAYDAFLRGEQGLDGSFTTTIAPVPGSKYAILDMNDDGIPELATTTVIWQNRDPETGRLESTQFDCLIFSYRDGAVFRWGGGNSRHHEFEILSNRALLYDYDDGTGVHEVLYEELGRDGTPAYRLSLYRVNANGRCYLRGGTASAPDSEISQTEWDALVSSLQALRTDLIPWADYPQMPPENGQSTGPSTEPAITLEEALERVRACTGHQDSYIPLRYAGSGTIGDVYSASVSEDQLSAVCLFYDPHPDAALNETWFFFHLGTYFLDRPETGNWHASSLNDFAVHRTTGEVVARLAEDGSPNKTPGSPYWT